MLSSSLDLRIVLSLSTVPTISVLNGNLEDDFRGPIESWVLFSVVLS